MTTVAVSPKVIQKIPIFRGFNDTECRQIADVAQIVTFKPGDMVIKQGEQCRNLWVVLEGKCEVYRLLNPQDTKSDTVPLAVLEPFSHFGEMSFFHPAPHSANVRAKTAVQLLKITHASYEDMIEDGVWAAYKLAYNCVDGMAQRLRRMDEWIASLLNDHPPAEENGVPEWVNFREKLFDRWNL